MRAYESGRRNEAEKILERDSFKENMFRGTQSKSLNHTRIETNRESDAGKFDHAASAETMKTATKTKELGGEADIDFSALELNGVKLSDAPKEVSSAAIKAAVGASQDVGSSFSRG